jgi:hypothetical protein
MSRRIAAEGELSSPAAASRLKPPDDLAAGSPERALFLDIVLNSSPRHFRKTDAVLLGAYCRAAIQERVASSELAACGYIDANGKPSGRLNVLAQATRSLTVISRLLELNPIARQAAAEAVPEVASSYYSRVALEARHEPSDRN